MILKKRLLLPAAFLFFAVSLFAQTAAEMDTVLEAGELSAGAAARFTLGAAGLVPGELSGGEAEAAAYGLARDRGWVTRAANETLALDEAAFLVMSAFQIEGGFMYWLFPGPRYAYREMVYRRLIQGRADPGMNVSGRRLLQIIGRAEGYVQTAGGAE